MRSLLKPLVLGACLMGPGCSFVANMRDNMLNEPFLACDETQIIGRNLKLGKQAWNEMIKEYGESFSCDYRFGFTQGFADYLTYGGCVGNGGCCTDGTCGGGATGSSGAGGCATGACATGKFASTGCGPEYPVCPAVPGIKYRRKKYMTPEGCQAIEDWYMGFRHGAATAQASGLRTLNVIPVQCPPHFGPDDSCSPPESNRPRPAAKKDEAPPMPPPSELVPEPRPGGDSPPATGGTLPEPRPAVDPRTAPPPLPPTPLPPPVQPKKP